MKPEYKYEYERTCRQTRYLQKSKKDYEAGKITVEEALKAFDEVNNIK